MTKQGALMLSSIYDKCALAKQSYLPSDWGDVRMQGWCMRMRGGLLFAVTASKIYSGRIFGNTIFRPFGKRCFTKFCVTFYLWDENFHYFALKSTTFTIIEAIINNICTNHVSANYASLFTKGTTQK